MVGTPELNYFMTIIYWALIHNASHRYLFRLSGCNGIPCAQEAHKVNSMHGYDGYHTIDTTVNTATNAIQQNGPKTVMQSDAVSK